MIPSLTSCNVDDRLHRIIASKDCQIHNRFPVASLILRSQAQCRASYLVHFLEHIDMFTQFFSVARHRRFEDVQAMVDLISDARQISSLLVDTTLHYGLSISLYNLVGHGILLGFPTASSNLCIQGVKTQHVSGCNKATAFPLDIILLDSFPVYTQRLTHKPSLLRDVHYVNASLNQGFNESVHPVHQLSSSNIHPPYLSGRSRRGRGTSVRIGIVARNPKGQPLQKGKTK